MLLFLVVGCETVVEWIIEWRLKVRVIGGEGGRFRAVISSRYER